MEVNDMRERATADYWREVKAKYQQQQKRRHCADLSRSTTKLRTAEPITHEMARARTRLAELSESR
jgi:hypothetical protein